MDKHSKIESNSIFDYRTYRRWTNHMNNIERYLDKLTPNLYLFTQYPN